MKRISSASELEDLRKAILQERDPTKKIIRICNTGCRGSGSIKVADAFVHQITAENLQGRVTIKRTGCHGFCEMEPFVLIEPSRIFYPKVSPDKISKIIKSIYREEVLEDLLFKHPETGKPIVRQDEIPFYSKQLFEKLNFQVIEGDTNITDGVWAIFTPGHTRGSQSVVVDTPKGRVIIAGLCTIQLNFEPPEPYSAIWPVITPGIHSDVEQSYKSLLRIKTIADTPVAPHDIKWSQVESIG